VAESDTKLQRSVSKSQSSSAFDNPWKDGLTVGGDDGTKDGLAVGSDDGIGDGFTV
jgi:hypothetical protein